MKNLIISSTLLGCFFIHASDVVNPDGIEIIKSPYGAGMSIGQKKMGEFFEACAQAKTPGTFSTLSLNFEAWFEQEKIFFPPNITGLKSLSIRRFLLEDGCKGYYIHTGVAEIDIGEQPELIELSVSHGVQLNKTSVAKLKTLPKLERLSYMPDKPIGGLAVDKESLFEILQCRNLRSLSLASAFAIDELYEDIVLPENLESLIVRIGGYSNERFPDEIVQASLKLKKLKELFFSQITSKSLESLTNASDEFYFNLESLKLYTCEAVDNKVLRALVKKFNGKTSIKFYDRGSIEFFASKKNSDSRSKCPSILVSFPLDQVDNIKKLCPEHELKFVKMEDLCF